LLENLPNRRYAVLNVANVVKALLVQLEELGLQESLRVAESLRPMLQEMEDFQAGLKPPQYAFLNDPFAERLIALAKQLGSAVRTELGMIAAVPSPSGSDQPAVGARGEGGA
jgi:hypothetical protein